MINDQHAAFWSSWRKGVVIGLAVLMLLALAFSAGRFSAPERVTDHWHTLDLKTEDITRGFTFAKQVEVTRWRNVVTTITTTPDAGTTTVITDNTIEREGSSETGTHTEEIKRVEFVEVERERTVTLRPEWRVSGQVGASLVTPAIPIAGPLVIGGSVEHRIIGGVSAGLWGSTVGAGGVVVSGEF